MSSSSVPLRSCSEAGGSGRVPSGEGVQRLGSRGRRFLLALGRRVAGDLHLREDQAEEARRSYEAGLGAIDGFLDPDLDLDPQMTGSQRGSNCCLLRDLGARLRLGFVMAAMADPSTDPDLDPIVSDALSARADQRLAEATKLGIGSGAPEDECPGPDTRATRDTHPKSGSGSRSKSDACPRKAEVGADGISSSPRFPLLLAEVLMVTGLWQDHPLGGRRHRGADCLDGISGREKDCAQHHQQLPHAWVAGLEGISFGLTEPSSSVRAPLERRFAAALTLCDRSTASGDVGAGASSALVPASKKGGRATTKARGGGTAKGAANREASTASASALVAPGTTAATRADAGRIVRGGSEEPPSTTLSSPRMEAVSLLVEAVSLSYGAAPSTASRALSALSAAALASGHLHAGALCLHLSTGASLVTQVGWMSNLDLDLDLDLYLDPYC